MEIVIRAAVLSVAAAVLTAALKKESPAFALLIAIALGCTILYLVSIYISKTVSFTEELADTAGVSAPAMAAVMKTVAISIVTRISCAVCEEAGEKTACTALEIAGAAAALFVALPFIEAVMEMITELA